jgi:hypothetical protein
MISDDDDDDDDDDDVEKTHHINYQYNQNIRSLLTWLSSPVCLVVPQVTA